jgi:hypothetical protein
VKFNATLLAFSEIYSNFLYCIKPIRVRLKTEPQTIFNDEYVASLKKILFLSERLHKEEVGFAEAKLDLDTWFYQVTADGILTTDYKSNYLVTITEAADELNVSRSMIYKYIDRGLEVVGEKGNQKVPRYILNAWKNPALALQIQWIHGIKKLRTQTKEEKLEFINKEIVEFEKEYRGTYHRLFGHLSDEEIDEMAESVDIMDWKKLELRKQRLLEELRG